MISDLAFTISRFGYLVFLWLLVFAAVGTLRHDIFGTVITPRGKGRKVSKERRKHSRKATAGTQKVSPHNILITGGPLAGMVLPLGDSVITIGRSPSSSLVIEDEYVSSRHARLSPTPNGWVLEDLSSSNGTYIDDERLTQPVILPLGTMVRIGQTTLELVK